METHSESCSLECLQCYEGRCGSYISREIERHKQFLELTERRRAVIDGLFTTGVGGSDFPIFVWRFPEAPSQSYHVKFKGYELDSTMLLSARPLRSISIKYDSAVCLLCQWRSFNTSHRRLAEKEPPAAPSLPPSPLDDAPRAYGKAVSEFTPKPLNRPIGLPNRPRPGENWGIDTRTWKQRRDDFVDYDKHLVRRKQL